MSPAMHVKNYNADQIAHIFAVAPQAFAAAMGTAAPKRIFAAAKKDDTLELLVYDSIGESWWGAGVTASAVKAKLDEAGEVKKITVRLNSPGGDIFEGAAIYSLLTQHEAEVECYVDGIAASAAFTIAMAGDKVHISEAATMMCHNAWGMCAGDAADMLKMADVLKGQSDTMCNIYSARAGMKPEECQALMDAETWMNAAEAVEYGFADDVIKRDAQDDTQARALAASFDLSKFKHAPRAETKTKSVDGEDLPKSAFAYQGSDDLADWKLPIKFSTEEKTKSHIRNAIARWSSTDMPNADEKSKARGRIKAAAKEHDIDLDEDNLKDQAEPAADMECECDCAQCEAGNCAECSNMDCDDPNCEDCPQQASASAAAPPVPSGSADEVLRWRTEIASL